MKERIGKIIKPKVENLQRMTDENLWEQIATAVEIVVDALKRGKKVLACGNGGSAADAQHFVAELVVRFQKERRSLPAIALNANTSVLTAAANDYSFEHVFSRQVESLGQKDDVLLAISTSGKSSNIIAAVEAAKEKELKTIGLLGSSANPLSAMVDTPIKAPGENTARIQECHCVILHTICELIEEELFA